MRWQRDVLPDKDDQSDDLLIVAARQLAAIGDLVVDGLKQRGSDWVKRDGDHAVWRRALKQLIEEHEDHIMEGSVTLSRHAAKRREVREAICSLEEVVHETQEVDDVVEESALAGAVDSSGWKPTPPDARVWTREPLADLNIGRTLLRPSGLNDGNLVNAEIVAMHLTTPRKGPPKRVYRIMRGDGFEEDLTSVQLMEALRLRRTGRAGARKAAEGEWLTEGDPKGHVGKKCRRFFVGVATPLDGTVTKWSPAEDGSLENALWHMVHADGDEEDLELFEVDMAVADFETNQESGWITTGALYLGERGRIVIGKGKKKRYINGMVKMYYEAPEGADEDDRWRMEHDTVDDDGNEMELEEGDEVEVTELTQEDVDEAVTMYNEYKEDGVAEMDDESRLTSTLWPTAAHRERWQAYARGNDSDGGLCLAIMCLVDRAIAFGCASVRGLPPATACERWRAAAAAGKEK
jgi:hypothetical protein